jgi:hypothetical protein
MVNVLLCGFSQFAPGHRNPITRTKTQLFSPDPLLISHCIIPTQETSATTSGAKQTKPSQNKKQKLVRQIH